MMSKPFGHACITLSYHRRLVFPVALREIGIEEECRIESRFFCVSRSQSVLGFETCSGSSPLRFGCYRRTREADPLRVHFCHDKSRLLPL